MYTVIIVSSIMEIKRIANNVAVSRGLYDLLCNAFVINLFANKIFLLLTSDILFI